MKKIPDNEIKKLTNGLEMLGFFEQEPEGISNLRLWLQR